MRRIALFCVVLLIAMVGVAWAGKAAYKLVMSKDKELCTSMLKLFNEDVKKYGEIRYEEHKLSIDWKPMEYGGDEFRDGNCQMVRMAKFDINNDGKEDLVIKSSLCMRDIPNDSLFVFSPESETLRNLTWNYLFHEHSDKVSFSERGYDLKEAPKSRKSELIPNIGIPLSLEPFLWRQAAYISISDVYSYWIVIAKYKQGQTMEDICYLGRTAAR